MSSVVVEREGWAIGEEMGSGWLGIVERVVGDRRVGG